MLFDMLVWLAIIATIIGIYLILSYVNYRKSLKKTVRRRSPIRNTKKTARSRATGNSSKTTNKPAVKKKTAVRKQNK